MLINDHSPANFVEFAKSKLLIAYHTEKIKSIKIENSDEWLTNWKNKTQTWISQIAVLSVNDNDCEVSPKLMITPWLHK